MDEIKFEVSVLGARLVEIPDRVLSRDELRLLASRAEAARHEVWELRKTKHCIRICLDASDSEIQEAFANDPDDSIRSAVLSTDPIADPIATERAYDWLAEHPGHPFRLVRVAP